MPRLLPDLHWDGAHLLSTFHGNRGQSPRRLACSRTSTFTGTVPLRPRRIEGAERLLERPADLADGGFGLDGAEDGGHEAAAGGSPAGLELEAEEGLVENLPVPLLAAALQVVHEGVPGALGDAEEARVRPRGRRLP